MNNGNVLEKMETDSVIKIDECESKPQFMEMFNIQYIGKYDGEDGHYYAFLDSSFNLLYTYYNVE